MIVHGYRILTTPHNIAQGEEMLKIADLNNDTSEVVRVYTHTELTHLADALVDAALVRHYLVPTSPPGTLPPTRGGSRPLGSAGAPDRLVAFDTAMHGRMPDVADADADADPYLSASYKELVSSASALLRTDSEYDMGDGAGYPDVVVVLPGDGTVVLASKVSAHLAAPSQTTH